MRHPGLENRKKFAETQMMVVRFDSVHTDSEFRKVSYGMWGKLVAGSIQIVFSIFQDFQWIVSNIVPLPLVTKKERSRQQGFTASR